MAAYLLTTMHSMTSSSHDADPEVTPVSTANNPEISPPWGRVAADGTVYVRVPDGERAVGQYPEGTPEEALAFFTRRYDALAFEVQLLEQRIRQGALSPDEARQSVRKVGEQVSGANAVGDLAALTARLSALEVVIAGQRKDRRDERARKVEESKGRKEQVVLEAEKLAESNNWRDGANRLRDLLEEWKALPRLDKHTDDVLWHRFSTARTTYTRHRKAHFSQLNEKRGEAKAAKERLAKEAEELATSTEWGPTAGKYRGLMSDWKAAGPAPKAEDDALWKRFRGAQDTFFAARDAANAELDAEYADNAVRKEALLSEAEALLPVSDLDAAKSAFRDIADRWDAAGKVPRARIKDLEARMRTVEQAIRGVEDDKWKRSDPEKSARADDMVAKLEDSIAEIEANLAKARTAGNDKRATELEASLTSSRSFLDMARKAAADFS